ncbi:MAG TPA: phenylalanine--tRNA ligase subunit beta [Candidatus Saccharimonadales bacterium]|nr:phenylalanine--tRNA ligase subunit beta [Candidatus Saccharimonadales bacterium]
MRVALSLAKYYSNLNISDKPIDELVDRIGSQIGAVEEVISLKEQYAGVLIARVVSCVDHPDSDHLHLCKIDDGGKAEGVERDENGHVQVVCGAPNVREGLLVAWLPPGSTVPSTYAKDPFVLEARKLRGQLSNGMLASSKELGISDDHEGILEVDEDVAPGTAFADVYHLNDHIIDIENKMFTHRPDCFGVLGVYREIAGIYHQQFESPDWYNTQLSLNSESTALPLTVTNELPELVPRFVVIPMRDIEVKPSPVWLQTYLMRAGIRPINNIVDITNYLMYLTGQPLHAYDYDKVAALTSGEGAEITVRYPREGEQIALLNGKTIQPRPEAMMVAAGDKLICVGGIMGGSDTEVDDSTKNIILEAANWDMYAIRRTTMAHGLFTDAATRFNKGQSPLQNVRIIAKAVHEVRSLANGLVAGELADDNHVDADALERDSLYAPVVVTTEFVNVRLGLHLTADDMATLLRNVEFRVDVDGDQLTVAAPFWRTDIEIPEDIVEEVGRLYGYDHLPLELPRRDLTPAVKNESLELKRRARQALARAGANEVLTYTFVHGNLIDRAGQDRDLAFQISNALSPDLQYYRLSLTPSLLDLVHANIKAGYGEFALFEQNVVYGKSELDEDGLPKEFGRLALVCAAEPKAAAESYGGAAYYQARYYLESVLDEFALTGNLSYKPLTDVDFSEHKLFTQLLATYEPKRSAVVFNGEMIVGVVGEYKASVATALKLPAFTAGFEIFASSLARGGAKPYVQLPRFPGLQQDISLKVPADLSYAELYNFVRDELAGILPEQTRSTVTPLDIYQREDDTDHKQVTLRLAIASYERSFKADEVNDFLDAVASKASERFGAERV